MGDGHEADDNGVDDGSYPADTHEPIKLNAGSEQTKAQPQAVLKNTKEEEEGVLGKRQRKSSPGDFAAQGNKAPSQQPAKKPKVEDAAAKAARRKILEEKKRLLADIEDELRKISQKPPSLSPSVPTAAATKYSASAPNTPLLSSSTPAAAGRGGRGRARGAATAAAGAGRGAAKGPALATPKKEAALSLTNVELAPITTPLPSSADPTTTGPATGTRGKRKSPGSAGIPRRASHDVSTVATSPTEQGPVTRAKRARRPKRLDTFGGPASLTWALKQCQVLLKTLMTHRFGWPFNQPVDPIALNIPDYFDVIKSPMDLGTIKEQLDAGYYETEDEFADDVRLVWSNTVTYNQPGSDICVMANTLSSLFSEKFEILKTKIEERRGTPEGMGEQTLKELRDSMSAQREQARIPKTPNGRSGRAVREEDARPMTFEEKKKLSHAINNLPSEHLGMVVKIIHERMPQLTASGEEIEIDIDALNPATLRHLERYVRSVTQRSRRRGRTPSLSSSAKNVQNEPPVPLGTQQKIEDVERQIKALTEHQQALTQKGLARSSGETDLLMAAAEEKKKKRNDDESESSESETDGSDSSESSESETSDSESDSGSDSDSTDSEAEKKDAATLTATTAGATAAPPIASESTETFPPAFEATAAMMDEEAAASATSPATAPSTSAEGGHQENGKAGSAISFSFDPTLGAKESTLPAEVGNGDESLQQGAAVAAEDAPPKSEAPKEVALKNVDAWSELSDDFEAPATGKPHSPPSLDKTWSQFQTKKMQDAIREKERLEKEERERRERERREEERRHEEERRRRELEEAEERRRREIVEAELTVQRERERQRQAERLAREKGTLSMMEQSMLMASFEQHAPPVVPLFQYKQLDDEEADFGDLDEGQPQQEEMGGGESTNDENNYPEESASLGGEEGGEGEGGGGEGGEGSSTEGAEMELSPTAPLPVPASDEMEEGQI